ncbi:MAG: alpha/beta hydrolase [Bdellovibrionota bacterium]
MLAENHDIKKTTGTFESFDGTKIYYEVRGTGRPIVLCYGLACLINHWTHQSKYFSQGYQTIVFDYRGHHQSATPADLNELTINAICKDMKHLCDHLGIEKASFWGHSLGVQYLLRFYDLFPERVDDMVFINGFAKNPIKGMFGIEALPVVFKVFKDIYQKHPGKLTSFWKKAVQNPLAIPMSALAGGFNLGLTSMRDIEVYARGVASIDLEVFTRLFEEMMEYDATSVLSKIDVPVLIVSGTKDGVTPVSTQESMHEQIRGSVLLSVPYGSHCTQLDLPDFVNLRAEKFLNDINFKASAPMGHRY